MLAAWRTENHHPNPHNGAVGLKVAMHAMALGVLLVSLSLAREPGFGEYRAVQESLARVHPRMRAGWLRAHGLDDSYYTTFHSPESSGPKCVGRWPWGPSWELAGKDMFLYLGSGSGVRILSIADSVHPRMLGQINARSLVSGLAVQDTLLFVACGSWGAQIYSVSDPANPRELGSMDAIIGDLCVEDTFCYTAGDDSFRIYSVADPSSPRQLGAHSDTGALVVVVGSHAFVADGSGMNVYDVSTPSSPQLVNSRGGSYATLFVRDTLLFCSDVQPSYFAILDVSDPLNIRQVGNLSGYGGHGLYVDDYFAYLSCTYDHEGLFVIDITNPSNPQLRDSLNPEGTENWDPYVPAPLSYGYLASDNGGLVTLDMHNVNNLSQAWEGYEADQSVDIAIDNGRAYVANSWDGVQIVDVTDPSRPVSLGVYDTSDSRGTNTATARDSFAFVGYSGAFGVRSLRVLNVTDPRNPTLVAQESCYNWPEDCLLRDSLLYIAEAYQFQIFNVARPREPVLVGSCDGDGVAVVVQDSFAYTAAGAIRITNVARPDSPFVVSTIARASRNLQLLDTILVCAPGPVMWFNVANPVAPAVVDSIDLGHSVYGLTAVDSIVYASTTGGELYAISIANLHQPRVLCQSSIPYDIADRIVYAPPYLYLACEVAGVCIVETASVGIAESDRPGDRPTSSLVLMPNPTTGQSTIVGLDAPLAGVTVRDVAGRVVLVEHKNVCEGLRYRLDLAQLGAGVYFVEVKTDRRTSSVKIVKQ